MSFPHRITRSLLTVCMLCCIAETGQAQPNSIRTAPAAAVTGMRVVEARPQTVESAVYTVAGAVERPGVYRTSQQSVPLRRILEAAGGLHPQAQSSARIIRNGEIRFQVPLYQQPVTTDEWLLPGDIVVVPSHASSSENPAPAGVVPIVCVGLVKHPVVLPLDPAITTAPELARRLGQSPQLGLSSRIIDPTRGNRASLLTAGSVVFFDSRMIDSTPFQPGFLPDIIDLDPVTTSAVPGPLPADVEMPPEVPPSVPVQQVSTHLAFPEILPQAPVHLSSSEQAGTPTASTVPPMQLAAPAQKQASAPSAAKDTSPHLPLPPDLAQAVELFAPKSAVNPEPKADQPIAPERLIALPSAAGVQTAEVKQPAEESSGAAATVTQTGGLVTSLPPLKKESAPGILQSDSPAKSLSGRKGKSLSAKTAAPASVWTRVLEYLIYGGGALSVLIGSSLLISVASNAHRASAASQTAGIKDPAIHPAPVPSDAPAAPIAQQPASEPAPSRVAIPRESPAIQPIQALLNRSIPMVEEPIRVPSSWPLHGKVIGHRRCLLNASHEEVPGPHFRQRSKSPEREKIVAGASTDAERLLRNHLREIFRPGRDSGAGEFPLEDSDDFGMKKPARPELPVQSPPLEIEPVSRGPVSSPLPPSTPDQTSSTTPSPALPTDGFAATAANANEFDIVQPQPSLSEPLSAMSPLERALRILAVEKHG